MLAAFNCASRAPYLKMDVNMDVNTRVVLGCGRGGTGQARQVFAVVMYHKKGDAVCGQAFEGHPAVTRDRTPQGPTKKFQGPTTAVRVCCTSSTSRCLPLASTLSI